MEEDISNMAKKAQKKPAKKPLTKKTATAKKAGAGPKKAAAPAKKAVGPEKKEAPKPARTEKFFSVAEFADMTYLTEYGVMQWLKQGLLKGRQNDRGDWQVDASNLEVPNVKRLIR
jgi:hypothetical protein